MEMVMEKVTEKQWKTVAGAVIMLASAALEATGNSGWSQIVLTIGGALGLIGVSHRLNKMADKR